MSDLPVTTAGRWFGAPGREAFGMISAAGTSPVGTLILPPAGYAWWSSYLTLRRLAERLAASGRTVLRLQYHGSGNATGTQWEPGRLAAWEASVRDAAALLREAGCESLELIGVELGASLALRVAGELRPRSVALWRPIVNGRIETRTLRFRSLAVPEDHDTTGAISFAGSIFDGELLGELRTLDLLQTVWAPPRSLIVDGDRSAPLAGHLTALGSEVDHREIPSEEALAVPAEDAVPVSAVIDAIADWSLPVAAGDRRSLDIGRRRVRMTWEGDEVQEEVTLLTDSELFAITTTPVASTPRGTFVLLNSGSEPHVGPGRAWVELARFLAGRGHRVVRTDFRGWGESPDEGLAPGRPYDQHAIDDALAITEALERRGWGPVVLGGVCAGAWIAMRAVLSSRAAGVVALNPQMYWQPGDPVEALLTDTRTRRSAERLEEEEGRESGRWDRLDAAGERNAAGRWLDELAVRPAHCTLIFAEGDDGLEYLNNRLARRLAAVTGAGGIGVVEIPGIDHAMHRAWLRPQLFAAVADALGTPVAQLPTEPGSDA